MVKRIIMHKSNDNKRQTNIAQCRFLMQHQIS